MVRQITAVAFYTVQFVSPFPLLPTSGQGPPFSRVLAVGGHAEGDNLDAAEVIDVSADNLLCDPIAPYPFPVRFAAGGQLVRGKNNK